MNIMKWMAGLAFGMAFVFGGAGLSIGQILVDDFNDGNDDGWTHVATGDGESWGPGIFDASSGALNLRTTGIVPDDGFGILISNWDASADPFYNDGFLRATIRAENNATDVALVLRTGPDSDGYVIGANPETRQLFALLCRGSNCPDIAPNVTVGFQPREDWIIEAGAVGDMISGKIWRLGESVPDVPQTVSTRGNFLPTGQLGVTSFKPGGFNDPAQTSAFIDDIFFTPVVPGDANGDGEVNFGDLTPFATALTEPEGYAAAYPALGRDYICDVSGDGLCNFGDLAPFVAVVTAPASGSAVPEASTAIMAALAAVGFVAFRRRRLCGR